MSNGRFLVELSRRSWVDLDQDEKDVYAEWLKGARPHDLHMLLAHTRREARRRRLSSVQKLKAVQRGTPSEPPEPPDDP